MRKFVLLALAGLTAVALVACGSNSKEVDQAAATTEADQPTEKNYALANPQEGSTATETGAETEAWRIGGVAPIQVMLISATDCSDLYGDQAQVAETLYRTCWRRPEALAVTLSAFPKTVIEADAQRDEPFGIKEVDPWTLDNLLSCDPRGKEIQEWLLEVLEDILYDKATSYSFRVVEETWQNEYYLYYPTGSSIEKLDPSVVGTVEIPVYRTKDQQVSISKKTPSDDVIEMGVFSLRDGIARCYDVDRTPYIPEDGTTAKPAAD